MRVLKLALAALFATSSGCYDPTIADCAFSCADGSCPSGQTCNAAKFCVAPESTVTCAAACPAVQAGCKLVQTGAASCLESCSVAESWDAAKASCTAGWELAILDSATLLADAQAELSGVVWVGLSRNSAANLQWSWLSGGGKVSSGDPDWSQLAAHGGAVNTCAAAQRIGDARPLYSDDCTVLHPYACTPK